MSVDPNADPLINPDVRWEVVERLQDRYMAGLSDEHHAAWFDEYHSLTEDEQEVLKWKIEEGDSAVGLFVDEMKARGANSIAGLKNKPS